MTPASAAEKSMKIAETLKMSNTVDIDVKIIRGWNFVHSHGVWSNPSYFVEMQLGEKRTRTSVSSKGDKTPNWNMIFVFAADLSARLIIRVYCKHVRGGGGDHVIGEATLNLLKTTRNKNVNINVYDPTKETRKTVRGHLTLCLKVSRPPTFTVPKGAFSASDLQVIPQDVIKSLSLEQVQTQNLSPGWRQFLPAFCRVVSQAVYLLHLHPYSQVAIAAVAFAVKAVIDQIDRDEKIERLIQIIGDLYIYFLDAISIEKILSYKKTLERLLAQTSECAYFIADYGKIKLFAQRAVLNIVSDADFMIAQMENAFSELKVELLLGSSLQTAVVSSRILQKVENIENIMYIKYLPYSKSASWDSGRACFPGTRQDIINDVVSWTMNKTQQSRLYVLQGPLGCGKSSIAHTIAEIFHQQNRLGAAVFLDGCVDQKVNSQTVASTIAYQLAGYDATIGQRIAEIIKDKAYLASANIERQLPELIGAATKGLAMIGPIVIVVDGLIDLQEQHRLLTAIANSSSFLPANFCFVLTSRHEIKFAESGANWSIRDIGFDDSGDGTLGINKYTHQCLRHLFSAKPNLFQRHTVEELSKLLIPRALGMHYWIITVYRLLLSSCDGNDCSILDEILSSPPPLSKQQAMDHVYRAVLRVLHKVSLPVPANAIFHVLMQSSPTLSHSSVQSTRFVPPKPTRSPLRILEELDGIIETGHDQQGLPLFRLEPNFGRFIVDPQRCGTTGFHVDRHLPVRYSLAELCLDEMNNTLAHNLLQLDDLMLLDEEILDKEERIRQFIPGTLRYACCQWISYLGVVKDVEAVVPKIKSFLFSHLLHWFEVMSILGYFQLIIPSLGRLAAWFKKHHHLADSTGCHIINRDGIQFIRAFSPIISKAAMQICISALPLMASDTLLFIIYHTGTTAGRSDLQSHTPSGWATLNTPAGSGANPHLDRNTSSGHLIAKVESHPTNSVHFYDCRTDNKVGTSLPLQLPAKSTHFSPDKRHLLTVDDHGTISIWDVEKRSLGHCIKSGFRQPLIHHSARGNRILVGSCEADKFGRKFSVWNTATAECIQQFEFSISYWHNMALSPDGRKLAVQETNKTGIRFFDVDLGKFIDRPIGALEEGELLSFRRVTWSSNSDLLATVSMQDNIRLWTPGTSMPLQDPGCSALGGSLSCLSFSPDNSCVAALYSYSKSNSERNRQSSHARIWDTQTREIIWSEKLPPGEYSMSFLPDSQEILFVEVGLSKPPIRIIRLPAHMSYPPRIYKWTSDLFIQYSHLTSSTNVDFTSKVDGDGWVVNTAGERQLWVPYPGFELCSEDRTESDGQQAKFSQRKTLEVKIPGTDVVILRFKIDFKMNNK